MSDTVIAYTAPDNPDNYISVPDAHLLFNGDFKRVGSSGLKITGEDGKSFFIENYFSGEKHKHLMSPEGALLSAHVVEALAGPLAPGQFAQAGAQPATQPVIGRVDAMSGSCTVVRNGVTVALNIGDNVRKGDVVQTSSASAISVVFTDGSTFSLTANARMVLDEFVFSEGGTNNSAVINLVQGTFSFVAGQVAKTGDMKVETPVATMGIRGTAVLVEISANDGQTKFSVMVEPNGTTGSFNLYNKINGALIGTVNNSQVGWVVTPAGPLQVVAAQVNKSPAELAQELNVVQQLFTIINNYQQNPINQQQQDPGKNGNNQNGPQNSGPSGSGNPVTTGQQTNYTVTVTQIPDNQPQNQKSNTNSNTDNNNNNSNNNNNNNNNDHFVGVPLQTIDQNSAPVVDLSPIVTRVSVPHSLPPGTHVNAANAIAPAVSNDGHYVVFFSTTDVPEANHDNDRLQGDVFLYDRLTGTTTTLTDSAHIPNRPAGEIYNGFSILGDGSFLVFQGEHQITNQYGTHNEARLYVYDRVHDQTRLLTDPVSHQPYSVDGLPRINSGGNIVFSTQQYSAEGAFTGQHILVTNLSGQILTDIAPAQLGITTQNVWLEEPDISGNGRYVTFWAAGHSTNPTGPNDYITNATLYYYDRVTHNATQIATTDPRLDHEVWWASMSDDGRYVVFTSNVALLASDTNGVSDIYLWDRDANGGHGALQGITLPTGAIGNGESLRPSISSDGRYITFASAASNLVTGDANGQPDTFLYDQQTHTFTLISNASDGTQGNGDSSFASDVSSNGQIVVFSSSASNLVPGDNNNAADVFVVDRSGGTVARIGEDSSVSAGNTLNTHGSFKFSDANVADSHSVLVSQSVQITGVPNGITVPNGGFGVFNASVGENTNDDNPNGQINWTFSVDNAQVQGLGAGQSITQTYTLQISDPNGGTVSQDVRITITGRNDAPQIVSNGSTVTGSVGGAQDLTAIAAGYLTAGHNLVNTLGNPPEQNQGFGENVLVGNDDSSSGSIDITSIFGPNGLNFFGHQYTSFYINNNGNVTFAGPLNAFTPTQIGSAGNPIIAPFWADVDTRGGSANATAGGNSTGSDLVYYDLDTGNHVLTVTWDDVGYFGNHTNLLNAFQLQLIDRGNGDFDIVFRYEDINWTTGDASGGSGGLGGAPARAGYSAGDGNPAHYFELPGSGVQSTMLGLESANGNTGTPGVYVFHVRNGSVSQSAVSGAINFADADVSDHHTVSSSFNPIASHHQNALGVLTATVTQDTTGGAGGIVTWDYNVAPEVLNQLAPGSTVSDVFNVAISDGNGGIQIQQVMVTLDGPSGPPIRYAVSDPQGFSFPIDDMMRVLGDADITTLVPATPDTPPIYYTSTHFLLTNQTTHQQFSFYGTGFVFAQTEQNSHELTQGTITSIQISDPLGTDPIATIGLNIDAAQARAAANAAAHGDMTLFNALSQYWTYRYYGGSGPDTFVGGDRHDILVGNGGADILDGGRGFNELTGGTGADIFVIHDGVANNNVIYDFSKSDHDRIDLSGVSSVTSFADLHPQLNGSPNSTSIFLPGAGYLDLRGVAPQDLSADDFVFRGTALLSVRSDTIGFNPNDVYESMYDSRAMEQYGDTSFFAKALGNGYSLFIHGTGFSYTPPSGPAPQDGYEVTGGTITGIDIVDANRHPIATLTGLNISQDALGAAVDLLHQDGGHALDAIFGNLKWSVVGGAGNDQIPNGPHDDILTGGGGADTFWFAGGNDVITDFSTADGSNKDKIDLSGVVIDQYGDHITWTQVQSLIHAGSNPNDTVIQFDPNNSITLRHVVFSDLDQTHFHFASSPPLLV